MPNSLDPDHCQLEAVLVGIFNVIQVLILFIFFHIIDATQQGHIKIRQIFNLKPVDMATVRSRELLAKLELKDLHFIFRQRT